jgi:hypothetical protein
MANYDAPGLTYDSGVLYDAPFVPQPEKKHMAKVKLNMKGLSDLQTIQQCVSVKEAMTGNANFTTPTPTLTAFGALITTAQTALTAMDNAVSAARQATVDKDNALAELLAGVDQLATYVQLTSGGDEAKILSAGFAVRAPRKPAGVPGAVMNLFITAGDSAGELDLTWDPVPGTRSYEVQLATNSDFTAGLITLKATTKSKAVAEGLASGTRMWARVRSTNAAGTGAWGDVATKIVP